MNPQNAQRFADTVRAMVREIIRSRMSEDEKMDKLGRVFALYGYHAQAIGYFEAWKEIIKEQEGKR